MDDHYQTPLMSRAIRNAARNRRLAEELRLRRSAGRTGICFDNAMAESFFGALKNERVSRVGCPTREEAGRDITRYMEFWYNLKRLHSAVGYHPPREVHAEFEDLRLAA